MKDFLENLKNEPEGVRKSVAFFTAFCTTGIVAGAWLLFVSTGSLYYQGEPDAATASSTSPFASIGEAFQSLTDSIQQLSDSIQTAEQYIADPTAVPPEADAIDAPYDTAQIDVVTANEVKAE